MKIERIIYVIIISLLTLFLLKECKKAESFDDLKNLYRSSNDTLIKTRNRLNQQVTTTALIYGRYDNLKLLHNKDSSSLQKLINLVDKNTISASYIKVSTDNIISSKTDSIEYKDTIINNGNIYIYPVYHDTVNDKWQHIIISAGKDSTHIEYSVKNEFNLVQSWQSDGWFKKKIPVACITNLNPYTDTKEFKTFTLKENKGNILKDIGIGAIGSAIIITAIKILVNHSK